MSEYMGIFGFSWQEKIAEMMINRLNGTGYEQALKSFWLPGGKNTEIIDNLERAYLSLMAQGYAPVKFSVEPGADGFGGTISSESNGIIEMLIAATNLDTIYVQGFLTALYTLSRDGKIPYEKWNPQGYAEDEAMRKTFESELSFTDKTLFPGLKNTRNIILAGLVVSLLFFMNKLRRVL